ncbi:zinc ribbon domain-containing protein [Flavilitoribacter nigricans]|nr:C4-type zinc ribbon domain-containing protein [Flavilitoribacter nigricans]
MAELTVAEKLKNMFELQLVDSQIDEIQILKGELPIEVSDLEDDIAGLETRISRLENTVKDLEDEVSKHQANITEANALIDRYEKQMDNVKNNREYDALSKEIEMQRLEIQLSNKKIKGTKEEVFKKEETLKATQDRLASKQADLKTKKVELEQIIEKTDKDEKKLRALSDKAREKVEDRLMRAYDKIRTSYRNGLAVVTVERDACGGCFNQIPPQMQLEIAQRKKIIACEHCGRILVDDSLVDEVRDKVDGVSSVTE